MTNLYPITRHLDARQAAHSEHKATSDAPHSPETETREELPETD